MISIFIAYLVVITILLVVLIHEHKQLKIERKQERLFSGLIEAMKANEAVL